MDEIKLKPCPFCGWEMPHLWATDEDVNISCSKCGGKMIVPVSAEYAAKPKAIDAWNRRANDG